MYALASFHFFVHVHIVLAIATHRFDEKEFEIGEPTI
jgi:hypothetical protein